MNPSVMTSLGVQNVAYSRSEQSIMQCDLADDLNQLTEKSQKEASQVSEEISKQLLVLSGTIFLV